MHTEPYAGALRRDGQNSATTFPPPLWGRDRERGTTALLLVRINDPISPAPQPFAVLQSGGSSSSVRCGHPSPCPSPTRGEGTMWRAPSHLTQGALRPETCACRSAFAGMTADSLCPRQLKKLHKPFRGNEWRGRASRNLLRHRFSRMMPPNLAQRIHDSFPPPRLHDRTPRARGEPRGRVHDR